MTSSASTACGAFRSSSLLLKPTFSNSRCPPTCTPRLSQHIVQLAGDLPLLVRRHHPELHGGVVAADSRGFLAAGRAVVAGGIDADAQELQATANPRAGLRG